MVTLKKRFAAAVKEFLSLDDTPASYLGQAGKYCKVNAGEDALEFAAAGGLSEGNYTSWTYQGIITPPEGMYDTHQYTAFVNDRDNVLNIMYFEASSPYGKVFARYDLTDRSCLFASTADAAYFFGSPDTEHADHTVLGLAYLYDAGFSRSLQSYLMLLRADQLTIEVWRAGATALWYRDVTDDIVGLSGIYGGLISLTGKWIVVVNNNKDFMVYEGS